MRHHRTGGGLVPWVGNLVLMVQVAEERVSWRAWYALGLLFVVYVFNFIDRSILGMLNEPIRRDLGLSDTQMGFLGGAAFAIFYTFMGIPVARLADRSVRPWSSVD